MKSLKKYSRTNLPDAWIITHSGIKFYPLDPRPEEVNIVDICHALAGNIRFGGHVKFLYSVGEHSWRASYILRKATKLLKLKILLHDATEAYLMDFIRPLKILPFFKLYSKFEHQLERVIFDSFNIPYPSEEELRLIKYCDNVMLATEARDLTTGHPDWALWKLPPPLRRTIKPLSFRTVKRRFMSRFEELYL